MSVQPRSQGLFPGLGKARGKALGTRLMSVLSTQPKGPVAQAIFVAATRCNFCCAKVASRFKHVRNPCDIAVTNRTKNRTWFTRAILKLYLWRDKNRLCKRALRPLHFEPVVNWAGSVSEISPAHSFVRKNFDME